MLKKFKQYKREISLVGIIDWVWFVLWMRRDEFSDRLDILHYYPGKMWELERDRRRAHEIDHIISTGVVPDGYLSYRKMRKYPRFMRKQ